MLINIIKVVINSINGVVVFKIVLICFLGRLFVFFLLILVLVSCIEIFVNNLNIKDKLFNIMIVIVVVCREWWIFLYEIIIFFFFK